MIERVLIEGTLMLRHPLRYAIFFGSLIGTFIVSRWFALGVVWFVVWRGTLGSTWLYANDREAKPLRWWTMRHPWWVGCVGLVAWLAMQMVGYLLAVMFDDGGRDERAA